MSVTSSVSQDGSNSESSDDDLAGEDFVIEDERFLVNVHSSQACDSPNCANPSVNLC